MSEVTEPRVRSLVADNLGVSVEELAPEVSLTDDLAADSLGLLNVALALEAEFGIVVPDRMLERVRTYGDLVHATNFLVRERREAEARSAEETAIVSARIVAPEAPSGANSCTSAGSRRMQCRRLPRRRAGRVGARGSR